ncbi:MAG: phenylalanine tRNA synthetase, beta subunit [uncultured bacterium]|uniref:phenylalanine--tRNA ligase n=3 Tax=Candidatus Daviesiibacteriota TaxID=1752718 RepID=A0A0G0EV53_9BACT|nr:MAG: phenylalanine tRNA synthetase, beta subunit [uncultured bacterium]KKQ09437.1 MAG: Phenylalanine-tRNA ligase beta subunit [Candidatus Daviesbacteria bacterium GW2011_GWB1_36_5]OGE17242.1 MAG: phenylalanine--tRNA ligase subunit beta [Candidatus Daviesbacteria bacterium RIFCSPHIGHO2_01_FULL_36_37]OGE36023.1 MAG: phenylalanine--tRNA ligase subunit beta [Candidatus Daviesbacteria bacterium RIFCSPHIGHO2_12_FULL_37_16]
MKVSKNWLKELVDLNISDDELVRLLPLRTIGIKEVTPDFIELDMKGYNRADLLSLRGVAFEVVAITQSKLKFEEKDTAEFIWVDKSLNEVGVNVEDEDLAPIYCIAKIEGLKVEPSDNNWVKKLSDSGIRSINNVADVTNLVMVEYGQPLHAFDASAVEGEKIVVRTAKEGEELETLDGKKRKFSNTDLLITDPKKVLGIAGIMGGKNSEVSDSTTTILLEAAIFNPKNLRKTATRLGLNSEASKRFYHGLTKKKLYQALDGAIRMYESLGGKLTGLTIEGDLEEQERKIPLGLPKIHSLVGVNLDKDQVETYLTKLGFKLEKQATQEGKPGWVVTPPYFRLDVDIEEDLIEEVARMYGYENINARPLEGVLPEKIDQKFFQTLYNLKVKLAGLGLTEVQTYPYYSTKVLRSLGFLEEDNLKHLVKIQNPISQETEYLRMDLWPNLLEAADKNLRQNIKDVAVFEMGKVFIVQEGDKPKEEYRLAILISDGTENTVLQILQIFKGLKLDVEIKQEKPQGIGKLLFHPTKAISLSKDGQIIGVIAEIHPRIADNFGVGKRVGILEFVIKL